MSNATHRKRMKAIQKMMGLDPEGDGARSRDEECQRLLRQIERTEVRPNPTTMILISREAGYFPVYLGKPDTH